MSARARRKPSSKSSDSGKRAVRGLRRKRTPFEWTLLVVALLAIGAVLLGLFVYAGEPSGGEAELQLQVGVTGRHEGGPQVELTVRNTGGSSAEQVVVEVTMGSQSREVTLTRIPREGEVGAVVTFPAGTSGTPEAELLNYNQPT